MTGWYVIKKENINSRTNYVTHDKYGLLHRYILQVTNPTLLIDRIDRNGLNNLKSNLRIVNCSINKRNSDVQRRNRFNFNGINFEKGKGNRTWRVKCVYSSNEYIASKKKYKQYSKSFSEHNCGDFNKCIKEAVLFRIEKMKEFNYIVDERSETIHKKCLEENCNMEEILGISFKDFDLE